MIVTCHDLASKMRSQNYLIAVKFKERREATLLRADITKDYLNLLNRNTQSEFVKYFAGAECVAFVSCLLT